MAPLGLSSFSVHARAAYPSWNPHETAWRPEDHAAHLFAHMVKCREDKIKNRYGRMPLGNAGSLISVDKTNYMGARAWYGRWIALKAKQLGIADPVFIAIPNSGATREAETFNIAELAKIAAGHFGNGAAAYTGLRFKVALEKAEDRDHRPTVAELRANMALLAPRQPGTPVLVDDVYTQGHHCEAAALMWPAAERPNVVIVASRTLNEPPADPWSEISFHHHYLG